MFKDETFVMLPVPTSLYSAVCAVIANPSLADPLLMKNFINSKAEAPKGAPASQGTDKLSDTVATHGQENQASAGIGETATTGASPSDVDAGAPDVDAHGHAWDPELHASTKSTTKDGLWRMKVGITRPSPMPGFTDAATTSMTQAGEESGQVASAQTEAAAPVVTSTDEDDEFAAFKNAAAEANATDAAAKASVPARKWTDADVGSLCNQAAVKIGDPQPVKEVIAKYIPEGEVVHSRNIPQESREDFAKEVEAKAGIEFAG